MFRTTLWMKNRYCYRIKLRAYLRVYKMMYEREDEDEGDGGDDDDEEEE